MRSSPHILSAGQPIRSVELDVATRRKSPVNSSQVVGVLAFGQSLLFLLLWLFWSISAGAAQPAAEENKLKLQESSYAPTKGRDPFFVPKELVVKANVATATVSLNLQGILYEANNPSAIVNDQLVTLNKTVTLTVGGAELQVKAIQITRDLVVLEVGGQRTELHLTQETKPKPAPSSK
jgi:hypothetical protein